MREAFGVGNALSGRVAAADNCDCRVVQQFHSPFYVKHGRGVGGLEEQLGVVVVSERDNIVSRIGEPRHGLFSDFGVSAAGDMLGDSAGDEARKLGVACGEYAFRGFELE